jgi:hypothetical protein
LPVVQDKLEVGSVQELELLLDLADNCKINLPGSNDCIRLWENQAALEAGEPLMTFQLIVNLEGF